MSILIPYNSFTSWPPADGGWTVASDQALQTAGFAPGVGIAPEGVYASDPNTVINTVNNYSGSAAQLTWNKNNKQRDLDNYLDTHFDLLAFIRDGTVTTTTGVNVSNFLSNTVNNYRILRNNISNAPNVGAVNAIDVTQGWPSNP
jgi:hypothetical protein